VFSASNHITSNLSLDSPRYRGLNGEVENWMQWIDDSNCDDLLELPDDDIDVSEFIGGKSCKLHSGCPIRSELPKRHIGMNSIGYNWSADQLVCANQGTAVCSLWGTGHPIFCVAWQPTC